MGKIFVVRSLLLAAAMASSADVFADNIANTAIQDGSEYYFYNVTAGRFLAVADGKLTLADKGDAVRLSLADAATGSYTLSVGGNMLYTAFGGPLLAGTSAAESNSLWIVRRATDAAAGVYTFGCRNSEASAIDYVYYSPVAEGLAKSYAEPTLGGEWQLLTEANLPLLLTLDEASDAYGKPVVSTGYAATVHLKRTFTLGSWNTFCLPFAVDGKQLKEQLGDDVQLVSFTKFADNTLYCDNVDDLCVEAGKPYLIKPSKGTPYGRDFYEFTDITTFAEAPASVTSNGITFYASFVKTTAPVGATVLRKNTVYTLSKPTPMSGFRAYFASAADQPQQLVKYWSIGSTPTDISTAFAPGEPVDIYDLEGKLVRSSATSANGLPKGVYVVNGQKFTVGK